MKNVFKFLEELKVNNNKEWFEENRDRYLETKKTFLEFTELLINEVNRFDKSIGFPDPKKCMFRIFRDVRFSKDKTPYKSHYGSYIALEGRKSTTPGYYFHFEPNNTFIGGGIFAPPKEILKSIRTEIFNNPDEFIDLLNKPSFKSVYPELWEGDMLKTCPRDFPKDFEHVNLLRYKSYTVLKTMTDKEASDAKLFDNIVESFEACYDFNKYLTSVVKKS